MPGSTNPNYKGKGFSKHLPTAVADLYREVHNDPDLISHRDAVAILGTRARMLAARLHSGESGSLWASLLFSWSAFLSANKQNAAARESGDIESAARATVAAQSAIESIGKIIHAGNKDEAAWSELIDTMDRGSSIVTREQSRLRDLHQMMTVEQVMLLFDGIYRAVIDEVADRAVQAKIGAKLGALMNLPEGHNGSWQRGGSGGGAGKTVDAGPVVQAGSEEPPS